MIPLGGIVTEIGGRRLCPVAFDFGQAIAIASKAFVAVGEKYGQVLGQQGADPILNEAVEYPSALLRRQAFSS